MIITPSQSRGARGILDWTQSRLAAKAGVSLSTVRDFEAGRRTPIGNNLAAMQRAFESAGVEFLNDDSSGVRLRPGAKPPSAPSKGASAKKTGKPSGQAGKHRK